MPRDVLFLPARPHAPQEGARHTVTNITCGHWSSPATLTSPQWPGSGHPSVRAGSHRETLPGPNTKRRCARWILKALRTVTPRRLGWLPPGRGRSPGRPRIAGWKQDHLPSESAALWTQAFHPGRTVPGDSPTPGSDNTGRELGTSELLHDSVPRVETWEDTGMR